MVKEGRADRGRQNGRARISLSFPFNVDETCPEPMRRALLDGMAPDRTGRGLAVAHHYRTINHYHTSVTGTEAPPHVGGSPLPQARPKGTQMTGMGRHRMTGKEAKGCPM